MNRSAAPPDRRWRSRSPWPAARPPRPTLVVSGTVEDRVETVAVPAVSVPAVNLDAGFTTLTGATNPVTGRTAHEPEHGRRHLRLRHLRPARPR